MNSISGICKHNSANKEYANEWHKKKTKPAKRNVYVKCYPQLQLYKIRVLYSHYAIWSIETYHANDWLWWCICTHTIFPAFISLRFYLKIQRGTDMIYSNWRHKGNPKIIFKSCIWSNSCMSIWFHNWIETIERIHNFESFLFLRMRRILFC